MGACVFDADSGAPPLIVAVKSSPSNGRDGPTTRTLMHIGPLSSHGSLEQAASMSGRQSVSAARVMASA
jgi:hypothetical protein